MKKIFILCLGIGLLFSYRGFGQVGEKVFSVNILNMNNDTVALPMLGQKNLLIFYADPLHPGQNKTFRDYFKTHPVSGLEITSYGIVNLAAAPMLPNALIKRMALKEVKGTDGKIYFDPDGILATAWKLPGANNNFTVIFINKNQVIEFYKAGQLTPEEQEQVIALVRKYSN